MTRTIEDYPAIQQILDDCAIAVEKEIGLPVTVNFKINIHKRHVDDLVSAVCNVCNVTWPEIRSNKRYHNIVIARHLFCWFGTIWLNVPLVKLGEMINRDHSSVCHARDGVNDQLEIKNEEYTTAMEKIKAILIK